MNKLDAFNKDKIKCKKCKEYFDEKSPKFLLSDNLCKYCTAKWNIFKDSWYSKHMDHDGYIKSVFKDFLNE